MAAQALADVNAQYNQPWAPIESAVRLQVVRMLIECNAYIEVQTVSGSPLHQAASRGDISDQVGIM